MKKRAGRNMPAEKAQSPDCGICIHRRGCEYAEEGSFCTRFQSRDPEPRVPDPNDLWERGEDVEF